MRVTTVDPISGNEVKNPTTALSVIEGSGHDALVIHFENEQNMQAYLSIESKTPQQALIDVYNGTTGHAQEM